MRFLKWAGLVSAFLVVAVLTAVGYVRSTGLRARATPGALETRVARTMRSLAISSRDRARENPVTASEEALQSGLEHYADHCAVCHGNDGRGLTDFGRGLFPPPPDLRAPPTQELTDGELFYVIENGIRFTGMPAFSTGTPDGEAESWKLVHFIRRLPQVGEADLERMKALNPRSPAEIRLELEEERFLRGEGPP